MNRFPGRIGFSQPPGIIWAPCLDKLYRVASLNLIQTLQQLLLAIVYGSAGGTATWAQTLQRRSAAVIPSTRCHSHLYSPGPADS